MKTTRLFDENSHLYTFEATVLSAEAGKAPDTLNVVLNVTAFFPEGGGQYADPGTLGGCPVVDVQETGETIMRQLTSIRIGRARQLLLENPDLPVYKVGELCGFRSPSYFGKVFRAYTGVSPQKLAQKHS
jgi:hypothetical protein